MSETSADQELRAMQVVVAALTGLDSEARGRVIEYILKRFGAGSGQLFQRQPPGAPRPPSPRETPPVTDILSLKQQKAPRNSVEMTALVAYYLAEIAAGAERKETIGSNEIKKYFRQADFPLPPRPRQTLFQAKNAGYLDPEKHGEYKLNPVGYNLVKYYLPASDSREMTKPAGPKKRRLGKRRQKRGAKRGGKRPDWSAKR